MTKLNAATISGPVLSDMFFNHEHPNHDALYDALYDGKDITRQQEDAAILEDAKEFCTGIEGITPEELAEDFMNRL